MSEAAAPMFDARRRWALPGSAHDRIVATANWVLPVLIGVLTAFLVMAPLTTGGDVSFVLDKNKVEVAKERLKIQSARYRGEDGKGQPFELTAGSAIQKSSAEPIVRLQKLAADIRLSDGPASLVANQGRYNMDTEQVTMEGPIAFRAPDGYTLDTHDATVDLKTRRLQSGGAVTGTVRQGTFSANRLDADLDTHTVTLTGNARLHIVPRGTR
ncbi:LPS export ABC transporter periplasmic protein LptC [Sphingomonas sp. CL5.1]|uniref:LPS export ABC transporter periplasmic protein LptC n=1 Tax=Sphingomonas sp. CL5.1 TaxID=2653203 RepID=UPI0015813FDA|nr:LPS export ABC transporter periplasmic protein LptC [Sphingomonas sp. CL5.1]QKR99057.1 LPS export ABC transporter periplasmic protein LptC [Sphingomonas sp. CL5.1]